MAKINLKRGLTDIVLYLIIFIVVQIIVMYAGVGIWAGIKGEGYQATLLAISSGSNPILTALTSAFSKRYHPRHLPEDEVATADPRLSAFQALGNASLGWHCSPWEPSFLWSSYMSR